MTPNEYNECVELYSDRLFRFLLKLTKQEADARDLVQHAFEILWKKKAEIVPLKAKSFLFTVARNYRIDQFRKNKRMDFPETMPVQTQKSTEVNYELKDLLDLGLQQLSEIQRSVILLRDYEGYSYKEIAQITDLSEAQVKVYIFRGRKKLKHFLTQQENPSIKSIRYEN